MQTFWKPLLALAAAALLCSAQQPPPPPNNPLPPAAGEAKLTWKAEKGEVFFATWKYVYTTKSSSKNARASFSEKREAEMEWTAETGIQGYGRFSVQLLNAKWNWSNAHYAVDLQYEKGNAPKENIKYTKKQDPSAPSSITREAEQKLAVMKHSISSRYTVWVAADATALIATAPGQMNDGLFRTVYRRLNPIVPQNGFDPAAGWPVPLTDLPFDLTQIANPEEPHLYKVDYDPKGETKIEVSISGDLPSFKGTGSLITRSGKFSSVTVFSADGYLAENTRKFAKSMNDEFQGREGKVTTKTEVVGNEVLEIDPGPAPAKGKKGTSRREAAKAAKKAMDMAEARQTVLQYIIEKKDQLTDRPLKFQISSLVGDKTVVQDIDEKEITLGITIAGGTASTPLPVSGVSDQNLLNLLRMIIRKPEGKLGEAVEVVKSALE